MDKKIKITWIILLALIAVGGAVLALQAMPGRWQGSSVKEEEKYALQNSIAEQGIKDFSLEGTLVSRADNKLVINATFIVKQGSENVQAKEDRTILINDSTLIKKFMGAQFKVQKPIKLSDVPDGARLVVDTHDNPMELNELTATQVMYMP
jgi:hypothetical protein